MAVLPYQNRNIVPIGREGGSFTFDLRKPVESQNNPLLLNENELLRQISVLEEINAQRGLSQAEAEQLANLRASQEFKTRRSGDFAAQEIERLFGDGGSGGGTVEAPAFDQSAFEGELEKSIGGQRSALDAIFSARRKEGLGSLEDLFAKQRGQTIEEQAALGSRLLSPSGQASIADVDAAKAKAMADFITSLSGEEGRARLSVETALPQQILAGKQFGTEAGFRQAGLGLQGKELSLREKLGKAGLLQSSGQFGQTLGLEKEKLAETKRRMALDDLFNQESLELAERAGKATAGAAGPSALGQLSQVVGGIGGLAGGVGTLFGGLGSARDSGLFKKRR